MLVAKSCTGAEELGIIQVNEKMRVLMLTTSLSNGGAAHAASRTIEALRKQGVEVRVLTLSSIPKWRARLYFLLERGQVWWHNGFSRSRLFRFSPATWGVDLADHPWVAWADVLHLHWVSHGFLTNHSVKRLTSCGKPLFWSLHDFAAITGGCHLPFDILDNKLVLCPRYEAGCGFCPLLGTRAGEHDLSVDILSQRRFVSQGDIRFLAVSHGEARLASQSYLMRGLSLPHVVPPLIDTEQFSPRAITPAEYPEWWEADKYYILIVASRIDDPIKGMHLLIDLTRQVCMQAPKQRYRLCLLLVGEVRQSQLLEELALEYKHLGTLSVAELSTLYNLATLTLSTSLYETFGQTLSESLASGCPVLSFAVDGPCDIVQRGRNGYLAKPYDTSEMAMLLLRLLGDIDEGRITVAACRESAICFSARSVAERLIAHYQSSLYPDLHATPQD